MNLLDIILLAVLGHGIYKGYRKGVFATLSSVAGYIIGLIGTFILYQPLRVILEKKLRLGEKLSPWVADKLFLPASTIQVKIGDVAVDKAAELINQKDMPDVFKEIMTGYVRDFAELPAAKGIDTLGEGVAYTISSFLLNALSFMIVFAGLTLLFRIVLPKLFNTVNPKPVTFADKLGGAALGTCGGLMSVVVLIVVLIPLASLGTLQGNPGLLANQMHNSAVVEVFMSYSESFFKIIF